MNLFRHIHLPYVVERLTDGRHIVLNRIYKPIGTADREQFIVYEDHPDAIHIHGLTPAKIKALSCCGDDDIEQIYLYDDGSTPDTSAANWDAYSKRLQILSKLKVGAKP